jgi:hypothetical protein
MGKKPSAQLGTTQANPSAPGLAADAPLVLTLRDVEVPLPPARASTPLDDGLVLSDTELQPEPWLGDPDADREAQRAARRAQVRRDRHRDAAADAPKAPEMLVLSADESSCAELCAQLRAFGFDVQVTALAPDMPAPWPFAAVFVTMQIHSAEGGDTFDLCNQVREASRLPGQKKPLLVLATPQLSSTDRVRAGLAGCHEILIGPVSRGSVAQLLDARGIALPSDARRV